MIIVYNNGCKCIYISIIKSDYLWYIDNHIIYYIKILLTLFNT